MSLPTYIKQKPSYFLYIPWLNKFHANSFYPYIFVTKEVYKDLTSSNPTPRSVAILLHEETHRKRQKQMGWFSFSITYLCNPTFRFNEELLAVKAAMRHLKKHNLSFDFERKAQILSGWLYLWPVSKDYAKKELEKAWNEA